ncbi:IclR family transcriptional regulator [Nocardioides sp.]|uniref:IclR family transcriptional regulator n=1 Tax=Nocardioides sp. TaxID=35761 RepID=UPI00352959DD
MDRAVRLLRSLAENGDDQSLADLAADTGLNRATAWRILTTLADHRLVAYDRAQARWSIGEGLVGLVSPLDLDRLVAAARPVLAHVALQTGETAALAVLRGRSLVYVDEVTPPAVVAATWKGREVALHATSTGKVVLAFGGTRGPELAEDAELPRFTDRTITSPVELGAELTQARERGYAVCRGELEATLYGVSAPIYSPSGALRAVISVWGPAGRLSEDRFAELGAVVVDAATAISGQR